MLKICLVSDAGERWSSGIICRNLMKFLDPKIVCDFAGFRVIWFTPSDMKYDVMFLQCANRMQGRQIWKLRKIRDHLKADTRLTCGVRGTNSLRETGKFLEYYDAVECANKQLLEQVKEEKNPNAYLGRSGVDTQMFKPLDIKEPDEFSIGFAGSKYRRVKNFEAIKRLAYPIKIAAKQESFERQEWTIGDIRTSGFKRDPYDTPTYWNYEKMPIFHNCLPPNELIITKEACKPISDVEIGEKVLTHNRRFMPVLNKFRFPMGKLIRINVGLCTNTILTEAHPVLVLKPQKATHRVQNVWYAYRNWEKHKRRDTRWQEYSLSWENASRLQKGDVTAYPILSETKDRGTSEEELEFYGYFAGDGFTSNTSYRFGVSVGKEDQLERIRDLFEKVTGFSPSYDWFENCVNLYKDNKETSKFLRNMFGGYAYEKHLPPWCLVLPPTKQRHILKGLLAADGHIREDEHRIFVTISPTLATQVRQLVLRQGIIPQMHTLPQYGLGKRNVWRVEWDPTPNHKNYMKGDIVSGYVYLPIRTVEPLPYVSEVYNLDVLEDNSFATVSSVLHNSYDLYVCASKHEGGPNPVLEACACGKPVVSTNVAWISDLLDPEWIVEGDPGIDREAFDSLKAKVDLLASDPNLRRKVGKRNRREVIKNWDWRVIIKEWEHFFRAAWETR